MIDPSTEDGRPGQPEPVESAQWKSLLDGTDPALLRIRRRWRHLPHGPRCKVCAAPFHGVGGVLTRVIMHGQAITNPTLCTTCFRKLNGHPGGAEVDISVLFADIRGSTGIAETIGAAAFRDALQTFYQLAARAIDDHGGFIDKYLGDGVMALFIPVLAGEAHAGRALVAARELVASVERSALPASGVRVGAGVHRGSAFVGILGSGEKLDFSALGDTVNVAARLGSIAGPGEILASRELWVAAGLGDASGEARRLDIVGRREPLDVVVVPAAEVGSAT
jgi:adenylate cyclase